MHTIRKHIVGNGKTLNKKCLVGKQDYIYFQMQRIKNETKTNDRMELH